MTGRSFTWRWTLAVVLAPLWALAQGVDDPHYSVGQLSAQVEGIDAQVKRAGGELDFVEKQYTERPEPTDEAERLARYSEGQVSYLLGEYAQAQQTFYDLVSHADFRGSKNYPDALFYLADALYQQKNYLGSRVYLRTLLALKGPHYREGLARYLEIAGRLNEFVGIDEYINQAKGLSGGELPPELTYVYAKWLFRREDLKPEDRIPRAQNVFSGLAQGTAEEFKFQAAYFIGVGHVRLKAFDKALAQFKAIAAMPATTATSKRVQELAQLSAGRVQFELGKFDDAISWYSQIPRESDNFPDSLYETAWAYVRKGDFTSARNATEILLLVAEDSVLAPEAQILQGTLLLKLQKYDEAMETYNTVINTYAPVRDEIQALIDVEDPVRYFDNLIARNEKTLDVTALLPPMALRWATTRQEVNEALEIINSLEGSRRAVTESNKLAEDLLKALDQRETELFPAMQEGLSRADSVDSSLTQAEGQLTAIEAVLVNNYLSPEQKLKLEKARADAADIRARIETLPTSPEGLKARRERIQMRIDGLEKVAFQTSLTIDSYYAQLAAIQVYLDDPATRKRNKPEDVKAKYDEINQERAGLAAIKSDLEDLRRQLKEERNNAENAITGDEALKKEYAEALDVQRQLLAQVSGAVPQDARNVVTRANVVRADAQSLRERIVKAKTVLRDRIARRASRLRESIQAEQSLLAGYGQEVAGVSTDAKDLVGRIAFDSFKRVQRSFYDLVLKADVGVVDVAFTRKQDKTTQIQKLAQEKDRELRQLDDEFKEVLKDVD